MCESILTEVVVLTLIWAIKNNRLDSLAPEAGFEPATSKLTASCSTVELLRIIVAGQFCLSKFINR